MSNSDLPRLPRDVLAAEIIQLRQDKDILLAQNIRIQSVLALLELLPPLWHREAGDDNELGPMHDCADVLQRILEGEETCADCIQAFGRLCDAHTPCSTNRDTKP